METGPFLLLLNSMRHNFDISFGVRRGSMSGDFF